MTARDKGKTDVAGIEIDLLLDAIFRRYGYDFRSYARASVERRVGQFLAGSDCQSVSELIPRLLHDEEFFSRLVQLFSVSVTEMFRDPFVYRLLRTRVLPVLKTWSHVKIWCAGCATGEEVYSLAIVCKEENVYPRARLYATDFSDAVLATAARGIYLAEQIQSATRNYQQAGGSESFARYYHSRYGSAVLDSALRERITFANHNLVCDGSFGEMQLIFCRNVLIYFDRDLQERALGLFAESLAHGGFLCLGTKETLDFSTVADRFEVVDREARIYKKTRS